MAVARKVRPKFVDIQDLESPINIMIYGDSGCGKTSELCSDDNVLILLAETAGTESGKEIAKQFSNVKVWVIRQWSDMEEAYSWIFDTPDHGFKWVCIDSLTALQDLGMKAILEAAVKENGSRNKYVPAQKDYLQLQNMMKTFVQAFVDLPVNCAFTALARMESDEEGEPFLTPDIQGKGYQISQVICGKMSAYGYMKVSRKPNPATKDGKPPLEVRRIIWRDNGKIRGKDRHRVLAPFTEGKSLKQIREMIEAGPQEKPATRPVRRTTRRVAR